MNCPSCGSENRTGRKFCVECGGRLPLSCMACGTPHAAGEKFCGDCGAALAVKAAAAGSPQASTAPDIRVAAEQPDTTTPPDGERKTVTALFADIKGSTELMEDLDPEEARTIIDPALKLMIEAVGRYGGYGAPRRRERRPDGHLKQPCCARDEGRPLEVGGQALASNHRKLQGSRALVVSVAEKAELDSVRCGAGRRA
jgi:class 3 adenylate cyclase